MSEQTFERGYTHRGDMDGCLCGAMLKAEGICEEVIALNYDELVCIKPPCIVCDLNLPEDHPVWMDPDSYVFDHHPSTAPPHDQRKCGYWHKTDRSAAMLLRQYLRDQADSWDSLVHIVNAGDLWLKDECPSLFRNARTLSALLDAIGWETMLDLLVVHKYDLLRGPAIPIGQAIHNRTLDTQRRVARASLVEFSDFIGAFIPDGSASEVANIIAQEEGKPCMIVSLSQLSMISPLGVQVRDPKGGARDLAVKRGGGGHEKAAGFAIPARAAQYFIKGALKDLLGEGP